MRAVTLNTIKVSVMGNVCHPQIPGKWIYIYSLKHQSD